MEKALEDYEKHVINGVWFECQVAKPKFGEANELEEDEEWCTKDEEEKQRKKKEVANKKKAEKKKKAKAKKAVKLAENI